MTTRWNFEWDIRILGRRYNFDWYIGFYPLDWTFGIDFDMRGGAPMTITFGPLGAVWIFT